MQIQLLPLRGVTIFPHMLVHLDVGRKSSIKALEKAMEEDSNIFLVAQKEADIDKPKINELYRVGTLSKINKMVKLPGGIFRILVEGMQRAELKKIISSDPYYEVEIELMEKEELLDMELAALRRKLIEKFDEYVKISEKVSPESRESVADIEEPGELADTVISYLPLNVAQKQMVLEVVDCKIRIENIIEIIHRELEIQELEKKVGLRVNQQVDKMQKDFYLREKIKAIQIELGEDKKDEIESYRKNIKKARLPKEAKKKALKEVARLENMPAGAAETIIIRNYLDWLLDLPWSVVTKDKIDLENVQQVLDEDHCGLDYVKERIIEFLAVRQLSAETKSPILCFVGPPGVGKTSLAKSIARAMDRNFTRISLGGVRDEAEIRGHRSTYVGAMPGRIIQGVHQAKSKNPVFLIDEIDKLSSDFRGDPSAAMLEVLDPEQNNTFSDHFIEVAFDLSQVFFINTANLKANLPQALLDRMEVIHISGYTEEEKLQIAKRHLIPKQLKENGLTTENLKISEGAMLSIIREYTREAGVRNLDRSIASICRKIARAVVKNYSYFQRITRQNLHQYLGAPRYRYGVVENEHQVGTSTGLAWSEAGGEILSVEVTLMRGKGRVTLTGKLGDVMQESARAALSYIRSRTEHLQIEEDFYEKYDIHIHVPEGAISKDGPSAGIAMVVALVSAITGGPINKDYALTGEVTLRGKVLPVGGVKEKLLAAHRAGVNKVILPAENRKDLHEIPANVRKKLECICVEHMDEVLPKVLLDWGKRALVEDENLGKHKEDSTSINRDGSTFGH